VLCQHILMPPAPAPSRRRLFAEVTHRRPYAGLTRSGVRRLPDFVATGGYALRAYDRWQRLKQTGGLWHLRDPRARR
jgi:ATP-dependent Lhr-like helicase